MSCAATDDCPRKGVMRVHDERDAGFISLYVCDDPNHETLAKAEVIRAGHEWRVTPLPQASTPQGESEASLF